MKNLLLTGRPGIGKTTIIREVISQISKVKTGGFFTEELRDSRGERKGFGIETLDGEKGILAEVGLPSPIRVGRYGVNLEVLEKVMNPAIERALKSAELVILDEIGKMELASPKFKEVVLKALDGPLKVLATAPAYRLPFVDQIKCRPDVRLFEVTMANRDDCPKLLISYFGKAASET